MSQTNDQKLPPAPRLVAVDLDGTVLLSDTHELSPATKSSIQILRSLGIPTIVVTGRMFRSARRFAEELGLEGPLAAYQGALIREVGSGDLLHHDPVPLELAREILEYVRPSGCVVNIYLQDQLFVQKRTAFVDWYERVSGMTAHVVDSLEELLQEPPTKMGLGGEPDAVAAMLPRLQELLGERGNAIMTWPFFIEMTSRTATKSRALELLCERMGLRRDEVLAFGDSHNDADMLEWAGTGVAMGNAPAEVAAVADAICESVDDDGLTQYLLRQPWFLT